MWEGSGSSCRPGGLQLICSLSMHIYVTLHFVVKGEFATKDLTSIVCTLAGSALGHMLLLPPIHILHTLLPLCSCPYSDHNSYINPTNPQANIRATGCPKFWVTDIDLVEPKPINTHPFHPLHQTNLPPCKTTPSRLVLPKDTPHMPHVTCGMHL